MIHIHDLERVLLGLSYRDTVAMCITQKLYAGLLRNNQFWNAKAKSVYGVDIGTNNENRTVYRYVEYGMSCKDPDRIRSEWVLKLRIARDFNISFSVVNSIFDSDIFCSYYVFQLVKEFTPILLFRFHGDTLFNTSSPVLMKLVLAYGNTWHAQKKVALDYKDSETMSLMMAKDLDIHDILRTLVERRSLDDILILLRTFGNNTSQDPNIRYPYIRPFFILVQIMYMALERHTPREEVSNFINAIYQHILSSSDVVEELHEIIEFLSSAT